MPPDVWTNRNDNQRSSTYLNETILTPFNVNVNQFGKIFDRTVDGDVYAQPLVIFDVVIPANDDRPASTRNVVYVATTRNWVYAFDADDPEEFLPLWSRNFGPPVPREDLSPALRGNVLLNFSSEIGIVSTPVIRRSGTGGTIYFIAKTKKIVAGAPTHHLHIHAVDIATGANVVAPSEIVTSVTSTKSAVIALDPLLQLNRPGLLLMTDDTGKHVVYSAYSSLGDAPPFYGWVLAHDADTLELLATHCTTPDWGEGGIWQSGNGIGGDDGGFVYYVAGNGADDFDHGTLKNYPQFLPIDPSLPPGKRVDPPGFGSSIVKLKFARNAAAPANSSLTVADFYTPSNATAGSDLVEGTPAAPLNDHDFDLCAGPVLFQAPDPDNNLLDLVLGGGKNGRFYVLDREGLGGWVPPVGPAGKQVPLPNPKAVQEERLCHYHIHGAPVFWGGAPQGPTSYVWSEQDHLRAIGWDARAKRFKSTPFAISEFGFAEGVMLMPGGFIAVSANGETPNTGIVWASHPTENANNATAPGVLRAYDASTVVTVGNQQFLKQLWYSDHDPLGADRVGMFAKFVPPVVANGKVYLATFSRELVVYGLLPAPDTMMLGMPMLADHPVSDDFFQQTVGTEVLGSVSGTCERVVMLAAGVDIGGTRDEFQFYGQTRNGAGTIEITALITSIQPDEPLTKAGVMIRVSTGGDSPLDPGSPHASMLITADFQPMFISRGTPNAASLVMTLAAIPRLPYWVRVTSTPVAGQGLYSLSGSISSDGTNWQPVGQPVRIAGLAPDVDSIQANLILQPGVVLTAHDDPTKTLQDLRVAIFREVDIHS
jgi:hypothetical protein